MRGWVLAGGRSSRFGSDKAVFCVEGVPLAVRVARVLAEAGLLPGLLSRHPRDLGLPELIEPDGPRHPLWGVATALDLGEEAFFAPCDVVDLRVEQVRALLAARAVAADQPLLGVYPATFAAEARAAALAGARVREVTRALPRLEVGGVGNLNRAG